jgi:aminobenzoyl-glutamate utilization protein B
MILSVFSTGLLAQKANKTEKKLKALKKEVQEKIDQRAKMAKVMVDKVFSFAELGFHEVETSKYLTDILK